MRILAYILEVLVLGFIITAFIFIAKQEHIDINKRDAEAIQDGREGLDRLNSLLENDTTMVDTTLTVDSLNTH